MLVLLLLVLFSAAEKLFAVKVYWTEKMLVEEA